MSAMITEEELYAERAALRCLRGAHPEWTQEELALHLGRSLSWVKKWLTRLRTASPDDTRVLWSRSRAHRTPYPRWDDGVVARILEIRDQPPPACGACPARAPSSIICGAIPLGGSRAPRCPTRRAPSGASSIKTAASFAPTGRTMSRSRAPRR